MTEYRIVTAKYDPSGVSVTDPIYKGNYGNILRLVDFPEGMIPETFEMHFSVGGGIAKTQIGTNNEVKILDECLTKVVPITAWLFLHDAATDGETKHEIRIPVKPKDNVTDAEPTPVEQSVITQAIAALNSGVERAETAADAAEEAQEDAETAADRAEQAATDAQSAAQSAADDAAAAVETELAGYTQDAQDAATRAANSATDANSSREAADVSATAAGVSERNAATSATAAAGSASAAAQSATTASQKAEEAAGYAESISGSVGAAQTAAQTATAKAGEASQSASAAAQKAQEAASSATGASQSATAANTAKTQAETAKNDAVTARNAAQTAATNAAGSAQTAQDVADSLPADYDSMILVSDTQPASSTHNKIWIKTAAEEEYTIPTYEEFEQVSSAINPWLYLPIDETQFTSGYYVWSDGKTYTGSNYKLSPYIRCSFKRIKFNALTSGSGIQSIAFYSDTTEESFISGYENTEPLSTYPVHEMDVPTNAKYIRITKNATGTYTKYVKPYVKLTETSESMLERVDNANVTAQQALDEIGDLPLLSDVYHEVVDDRNLVDNTAYTLHTYVDNTGVIKSTTNPSSSAYPFCLSDYIPVESGRIIYLNDKFITGNYWAYYTENKTYLGGKNEYPAWGDSNRIRSHVVPTNAKYLRVTSNTEADAQALWAGYTGEAPTGEVINASYEEYVDYHFYPTNPCDYIGRDICVFDKIACIGDSITSGYFNHSGGGQSIAKYAYPHQLQKMTGIECVNKGDAGETSVSWWTAHQNDDFSGFDSAIINLGINDVLSSVSEADTRTAFANIISALKSANTGIKIFIASVTPAYSRGNTTYDAINAIIEDIANTTADCYFVDLSEYGHSVGIGYVNGHLTATGYRMMAQDLASAISYIIKNNPAVFRFVQFIGTNLHN